MHLFSKASILLFFILIAGCKKDNATPETAMDCLIKEYNNDRDNSPFTEIYSYDNDARLIGIKQRSGGFVNDAILNYDSDGLIRSTNLLPFSEIEFLYDTQNRLSKIINTSNASGGTINTYAFYEYDLKGHLSQVTWIPGGNHSLQEIYRPDFNEFLKLATEQYNAAPDFYARDILKKSLDNTFCSKYSVNEKDLTVTKISNTTVSAPNRKFGERIEGIQYIQKYDGKKNPKSSKSWRVMSFLLYSMDFSELGNIVENVDKSSFEIDGSYKVDYQYNAIEYPVSAIYTFQNKKYNLTWKYDCK